MSDTRETILSAARAVAQAHGYNGLSFRDLAAQVGIKSASIHYYFPTKGDLGAALARRYWEDARAGLDRLWERSRDPATCLREYTAIFRKALEEDNRMCLVGFMAAEHADLPGAVREEVQSFVDINVGWLTRVLSTMDGFSDGRIARQRALAIYAAVGGAQLIARSQHDLTLYDGIIEGYRAAGLIPG